VTREEAMQNLNLAMDASAETVEEAYRRLVRRYPPEFHPEKFRSIDDSYRQLTSLPALIERLLTPIGREAKVEEDLLCFAPSVSASRLDEGIREIRTLALAQALWGTCEASSDGAKTGRKR
jgi:hypothetical protein